ncbi:MAG: hypothetical protein HY534_00840 [Chloroflexi bacterium]|nr:hypothetical protein [Chloroflexota bacterium]
MYDAATGVVYSRLDGAADHYAQVDGAVQIGGVTYLTKRRHLHPDALRREFEEAGFVVLQQGGETGGEVICRLARREDAAIALRSRGPSQ